MNNTELVQLINRLENCNTQEKLYDLTTYYKNKLNEQYYEIIVMTSLAYGYSVMVHDPHLQTYLSQLECVSYSKRPVPKRAYDDYVKYVKQTFGTDWEY